MTSSSRLVVAHFLLCKKPKLHCGTFITWWFLMAANMPDQHRLILTSSDEHDHISESVHFLVETLASRAWNETVLIRRCLSRCVCSLINKEPTIESCNSLSVRYIYSTVCSRLHVDVFSDRKLKLKVILLHRRRAAGLRQHRSVSVCVCVCVWGWPGGKSPNTTQTQTETDSLGG